MIKSGFFNSVDGDRRYNADHFADYFASFVGNGIFAEPAAGFMIVADEDMTLKVNSGKGWINGYIVVNDGEYTLTLEDADGVLARIDRIVLRLDTSARDIHVEVLKGEYATEPVPPPVVRSADYYDLSLATVLIDKGLTTITQANITDTRMGEYCGVVAALIDQIDTSGLFAQYQESFEAWFNSLADVLDENAEANILNRIGQNTAQLRGLSVGMLQLGSHTLDISLPSTGWTDHPDEARYKHRQKIVTDVDLWESSAYYQYLLTGGAPYTSVGDITDEQVEEYLSGATVLLDVYYDAESMSEAEDCGLTKVEVTREGRLMAVTFHAEAKPAGNLSAKTWYKIHMGED